MTRHPGRFMFEVTHQLDGVVRRQTMHTQQITVRRTVARVQEKLHLGPDSQVDDKSLWFTPQAPALTDPFLVMADDLFSKPGFEWHPHRGLETVTLVLDGVLEHGDNIGHVGTLTAGDVQWMTAGHGIIHRELAFRDERAHVLQLWVNLPAEKKLVDSRYQDLLAADRPVIEYDGARVDVISGTAAGLTGPALTHWPVSGSVIALEPGRGIDHVLPGQDRSFFSVLSGAVGIAGRSVTAGQTAWSDPVGGTGLSVIALRAADGDAPSVVMTFSGPPIRQPVALGGSMVMNTRAEIEQAYRDFQSGKFGIVPRQARLQYR
ncbi:pirin family protein [Streptomyces sp. NPDC004237]|uniref:pirin family protein n=1 Tax=Streptomyces sp. NPDC004237 TaxID=3154455 RepID=UPI0033B3B4C4